MRREIRACDMPFCRNETKPRLTPGDWLEASVSAGITFDVCGECARRYTLGDLRMRKEPPVLNDLRVGLLRIFEGERSDSWHDLSRCPCALEIPLRDGERVIGIWSLKRGSEWTPVLKSAEMDGKSLITDPVLLCDLEWDELPFPAGKKLRLEFDSTKLERVGLPSFMGFPPRRENT